MFTNLGEDSMAYTQSQWHTVEATMISGRIKIVFDGQTLFAVSDTSHTAGKVALYSWNNTGAQFDEFAVTAAAGTVTTCVSDAGGLHAALVKAAANGQNDVIRLVRGQYNGNFFYSPAEALDLTILGGYSANCSSRVVDPTNTVLDGLSNCAPVLQVKTIKPADLTLEGLTLRNGGGFCETVSEAGGLAAQTSGEVALTRSVLSHNINADDGDNGAGGGANIRAAKVTLRDNTVEENEVGFYAGGLSITAQTVELTGNRVRHNFTGDAHGGSDAAGIYISYGYDLRCPRH